MKNWQMVFVAVVAMMLTGCGSHTAGEQYDKDYSGDKGNLPFFNYVRTGQIVGTINFDPELNVMDALYEDCYIAIGPWGFGFDWTVRIQDEYYRVLVGFDLGWNYLSPLAGVDFLVVIIG